MAPLIARLGPGLLLLAVLTACSPAARAENDGVEHSASGSRMMQLAPMALVQQTPGGMTQGASRLYARALDFTEGFLWIYFLKFIFSFGHDRCVSDPSGTPPARYRFIIAPMKPMEGAALDLGSSTCGKLGTAEQVATPHEVSFPKQQVLMLMKNYDVPNGTVETDPDSTRTNMFFPFELAPVDDGKMFKFLKTVMPRRMGDEEKVTPGSASTRQITCPAMFTKYCPAIEAYCFELQHIFMSAHPGNYRQWWISEDSSVERFFQDVQPNAEISMGDMLNVRRELPQIFDERYMLPNFLRPKHIRCRQRGFLYALLGGAIYLTRLTLLMAPAVGT